MANETGTTWKQAAMLCFIAALIAGGWGYNQSLRADQLVAQSARFESALNAANAQLQELSKHDLPITVSFRPALLGAGLVATIRNNSARELEISVLLNSPTTGIEKRANVVISAGGVKEIGHSEGWPFVAGQQIKLSNTNFRPAEYAVPGA